MGVTPVTTNTINKHDTNQLTGSINWFKDNYDISCIYYPILIHPSRKFENAASPDKLFRLINIANLESFKESISNFYLSIFSDPNGINEKTIEKNLNRYHLLPKSIIDHFTSKVN